jgi:hypothetical protein
MFDDQTKNDGGMGWDGMEWKMDRCLPAGCLPDAGSAPDFLCYRTVGTK